MKKSLIGYQILVTVLVVLFSQSIYAAIELTLCGTKTTPTCAGQNVEIPGGTSVYFAIDASVTCPKNDQDTELLKLTFAPHSKRVKCSGHTFAKYPGKVQWESSSFLRNKAECGFHWPSKGVRHISVSSVVCDLPQNSKPIKHKSLIAKYADKRFNK